MGGRNVAPGPGHAARLGSFDQAAQNQPGQDGTGRDPLRWGMLTTNRLAKRKVRRYLTATVTAATAVASVLGQP
jgi:hypothetical protein